MDFKSEWELTCREGRAGRETNTEALKGKEVCGGRIMIAGAMRQRERQLGYRVSKMPLMKASELAPGSQAPFSTGVSMVRETTGWTEWMKAFKFRVSRKVVDTPDEQLQLGLNLCNGTEQVLGGGAIFREYSGIGKT